jgi:carbonic anhydrase/acetyltransferase-like protein (isoleucine patch superfamily)
LLDLALTEGFPKQVYVHPALSYQEMATGYHITPTGSQIHSQATIVNGPQLKLGSRSSVHAGAVIDASKAKITVGSDCTVEQNAFLSAPEGSPQPVHVGDRVHIGADAAVEARSIGNDAVIGDCSVLRPGCIVLEGASVMAGTNLPETTVIPPFAVISSKGASGVGTVPQSALLFAGSGGLELGAAVASAKDGLEPPAAWLHLGPKR